MRAARRCQLRRPLREKPASGDRFEPQMLVTSARALASEREPAEYAMAKKQTDGVYKIVEVVGVSDKSWEEAGRNAVETAAGSLRDLRVAEVTQMDMKVEDGKVAAFRTRVSLSFKYEA
jgi:flavin-binding protein dodecin